MNLWRAYRGMRGGCHACAMGWSDARAASRATGELGPVARDQPGHGIASNRCAHGTYGAGGTDGGCNRAIAGNLPIGDRKQRLPDLDLKGCADQRQGHLGAVSGPKAARHCAKPCLIKMVGGGGPTGTQISLRGLNALITGKGQAADAAICGHDHCRPKR